jgi:hypothetical protein
MLDSRLEKQDDKISSTDIPDDKIYAGGKK